MNRGYYICFGDVENAFQQAPPPTNQSYLEIDDTIYDWYLRKFGIKLNRLKDVIPLFKNLQGLPESGALWEKMIEDILLNKMGFRNTTHERNLYIGVIDGNKVLVCRQVDDFASGAASEETAKKFIDLVREHVNAEYAGMGIETSQGVYQRFNGLDVFQTRDYVKIGCESYIDRMLQTHGWDNPRRKDSHLSVPVSAATAEKLQTLEGPTEKSVEAKLLEKAHGFSYRNVLGELMCAYVICHLDIGFAVCLLAQFSTAPHAEHFRALRTTVKCLRGMKSWGIIYVRPSPLADLPVVPFQFLKEDPDLPTFPTMDRRELTGALDAAHATDLRTRRSISGLLIFYCHAAITWKS